MANFSVPITLPPGCNGLEPQLHPAYSSGNGNGPFGLGWSVKCSWDQPANISGHAALQRCEGHLYHSGTDHPAPVAEQPEVTSYRPRAEGLFARIEHHHDSQNDFWKVWSKDGLISFYGTPRPDRRRIGLA